MTTDLKVANTIAEQIGGGAFLMMGTTIRVGTENSLMFNVKGCRKFCNKIRVTLNFFDLYNVEFLKVGNAPKFNTTTPVRLVDVNAEDLKSVIEKHTGLSLSIPRVRGINA